MSLRCASDCFTHQESACYVRVAIIRVVKDCIFDLDNMISKIHYSEHHCNVQTPKHRYRHQNHISVTWTSDLKCKIELCSGHISSSRWLTSFAGTIRLGTLTNMGIETKIMFLLLGQVILHEKLSFGVPMFYFQDGDHPSLIFVCTSRIYIFISPQSGLLGLILGYLEFHDRTMTEYFPKEKIYNSVI